MQHNTQWKRVQVFKEGDQNGTWIYSITIWTFLQGSHLILIHLDPFKRKLLSPKPFYYVATVSRLPTPLSMEQSALGKACQISRFSQAWGEIKCCYAQFLPKMPLLLLLHCCCEVDNPGNAFWGREFSKWQA